MDGAKAPCDSLKHYLENLHLSNIIHQWTRRCTARRIRSLHNRHNRLSPGTPTLHLYPCRCVGRPYSRGSHGDQRVSQL